MEVNQSAYREFHSTETALVKVREDILKAIDNKEILCSVLLDLSAAFDVIDHHKLVARMEWRFGLSGAVLNWIKSYITGRSQKVVIGDLNSNGAESGSTKLDQRVPQGQFLDQSASPGIHVHWVTSADPMEFMHTFMQMTAKYTWPSNHLEVVTKTQLSADWKPVSRTSGIGWHTIYWNSMRIKPSLSSLAPGSHWKR